MSRRAFRSAVDAPRPLSALLMVAAASATLDVTGQLEPWALGAQLAALGAAFALRTRPRPWQRSAPVLNTALAAIALASLSLWLRGWPSVVVLAHFATLTQGLQLLDARPRRSEFLLVALALFQVVLASNLTDSILFPVLLIVFLLATVWTLLVHTLRAEALEAGDRLAASQVATPGLLRTTLVASTASVVLALALFVVLPRMRAAVVPGGGLGARAGTAGFSDQVALGELGRIRSDPRTVLRVQTLEGEAPPPGEAYWRGLAFDRFDGRRWSVSAAAPGARARTSPRNPTRARTRARTRVRSRVRTRARTRVRTRVGGDPEWGVVLDSRGPPSDLVQKIVREPVEAGVLFLAGRPRRLRGDLDRLEVDRNGGLYAPRQADQRVSYTVATRRARPARAALRRDRAAPPADAPERYLQLPALSPRVRELALEATRGAGSDAERAERLEAYLRTEGRYTDRPPRVEPGDPRSPVERFLAGGMAGHCEYFASAMVLMGRSLGLPMRLVNGFAGGRANRIGGFTTLTRSDAHAWVEMHYAGAGWVRYDPTPPDLRARAAAARWADWQGWGASFSELAEAVELWWFQQVVEFDRSTQGRALRAAWLAWRRWRAGSASGAGAGAGAGAGHTSGSGSTAPADAPDPERLVDIRALAAAAAALGAAALAARLRRRRRRRDPVPAWYGRSLRLLARRGLVRGAAQPARSFAAQVAEALPGAPALAFARLTEAYLDERFGGRHADGGPAALRALRESLRRRGPGPG